MAQQNWGAVPDWFAAVGTIAAVGVALRFGLRDHTRLELERGEAKVDRQLFREERAADAEALKRRLAAKVTLLTESARTGAPDPSTGQYQQVMIWKIHNGSDELISGVSAVQRLRPGAPGFDRAQTEICKTWAAIEPGGHRELSMPLYREIQDYLPEREIQFSDGTGQRWQRKTFGALRSIAPDDPEALGVVLVQL